MSSFWDEQREIGRVDKNKREQVVTSVCKRQDKEYLDVRIYAKSKDSEDYVPTSKGFSVEKSIGKEILTLMQEGLK